MLTRWHRYDFNIHRSLLLSVGPIILNSWANLFIRIISREIIGLNFLMNPVNVQCVLTLELGGSGIRMGGYQNFWLQVPWISCIHTCTRCHVAKFLWSFRIENEKVDDEFMYVVCCTKIFYAHTTKCWKNSFSLVVCLEWWSVKNVLDALLQIYVS